MKVLVTGGASGLGEGITRKIAQNLAYKVYFTYLNSHEKADQIENEFSNTKGIRCDFKNQNDITNLCSRLKELDIDVLVNNAYHGDFIKSYFHKTDLSDFSSSFNDNVLPTVELSQAAINVFRKKKFGKIITISSAALVNVVPLGASVYAANKAYLEQLAKVWASENAKFNITSNIISPAFMLTSFTKSVDERLVEQIIDSHPLKKLLTVGEVADSVYFLIQATQQINGVNLIINAGSSLK